MKTVLKNSRHNHAGIYSSPETFSKGDDIKLKEIQSFFPPLYYLPFIAILLIFLFWMAWRLPLGGVKSNWNMGDLAQIIDTAIINPAIHTSNVFTDFFFWFFFSFYQAR